MGYFNLFLMSLANSLQFKNYQSKFNSIDTTILD